LHPRRDARFTPGAATRRLGPAESFDAFQVDLGARFEIARPGRYGLRGSFTKNSGVADGDSNEVSFQIVASSGGRAVR